MDLTILANFSQDSSELNQLGGIDNFKSIGQNEISLADLTILTNIHHFYYCMISGHTLYLAGQLTLSTQLIIPNYSIFL